MAILSRGAVIGALVAGAALAPGAAVAHTPRADQAGASLRAELRGLVRMPDGPPGAIVVVQRAGGDGSTPPACPGSGPSGRSGCLNGCDWRARRRAFSGAVALSLVAAHKLSLDDTIAKLLPQLLASSGRVTLRQALNHTSGLPDLTSNRSLIDRQAIV